MKIHITTDPLNIMILSTVEKYKSEVIGLLFGCFRFKKYYIEMALPLVTAETSYTKADYNQRRIARIIELYQEIINKRRRRFLGFYHSHAQYGDDRAIPQMSEADEESFNETEEAQVELIIAINDYHRYVEWVENTDGTISGTCGKYHVKLAGYSKQDENIKRIEVTF